MADDFVALLGWARAVAILRCSSQKLAAEAMEAAIRGGFRVVEFTFAVPGALELIAEFSRRVGVAVGAGTVLTREQVQGAVRAGARFIVSPVLDEGVIAESLALGAAPLPGEPPAVPRAAQPEAHLRRVNRKDHCRPTPAGSGEPPAPAAHPASRDAPAARP